MHTVDNRAELLMNERNPADYCQRAHRQCAQQQDWPALRKQKRIGKRGESKADVRQLAHRLGLPAESRPDISQGDEHAKEEPDDERDADPWRPAERGHAITSSTTKSR